MTMMFQVQDAAMLEGIEPDTEVDFDIDNSAGGFEITNIKPTIQ
jgi:Cu/Ag efflux protein CusF